MLIAIIYSPQLIIKIISVPFLYLLKYAFGRESSIDVI